MARRRPIPPLTADQQRLVEQHLPLVAKIATRARRPPHVTIDDLISHGSLGLLRAARRFDPSSGFAFSTYASGCIVGAIKDGLRVGMFVSRSARKRGMAEPTFHSMSELMPGCGKKRVEYADAIEDRRPSGIDDFETRDAVRGLAHSLTARQRQVIERRFVDDRTMREIGIELGITECRVSQIISAAIAELRQALSPAN